LRSVANAAEAAIGLDAACISGKHALTSPFDYGRSGVLALSAREQVPERNGDAVEIGDGKSKIGVRRENFRWKGAVVTDRRYKTSVFPGQHGAGEAHDAAAGDAYAQKATEKSALKLRVVLQRVDDGAHFLFRFRRADAPDAIQVALEITRSQATDEKCHRFHFRMHGIPKNAFLEIILRVREPGAKRGFVVVRGVHYVSGGLALQEAAPGEAIRFNGPGGYRRCCVAAAFGRSRCHATYHGKNISKLANPFLMH
jgi:hypothetical protein